MYIHTHICEMLLDFMGCRVCSAYGKFSSRTCGKVAGTDCRINDWKCELCEAGRDMAWSNALPQSCTTAARLPGCRVDIGGMAHSWIAGNNAAAASHALSHSLSRCEFILTESENWWKMPKYLNLIFVACDWTKGGMAGRDSLTATRFLANNLNVRSNAALTLIFR